MLIEEFHSDYGKKGDIGSMFKFSANKKPRISDREMGFVEFSTWFSFGWD
jgi:hypothetical protein